MIILSSLRFDEQQLHSIDADIILFNGGHGGTKDNLGPFDGNLDICTEIQAKQVEGVICLRYALTPALFQKFPNLKWIQLMSIGFDKIPKEEILSRKITLTNARGSSNIPLAEDAVCKLLMMAKNYDFYMHNQKEHCWKTGEASMELMGRKAVVLGAGAIGREVIQRFSALGMEVSAYDIFPTDYPLIRKLYLNRRELLETLHEYDCIVATMPLTRKTANFIDAEFLRCVKNGAYLINIARGGLVDMDAVCAALRSGRLCKAAVDVMPTEPLPANSPYWDCANLYITPHQAYKGDRTVDRLKEISLDNIRRYIAQQPLNYVVNLENE
ncbi:MAG: D-2-hydroxyacid dehydrogenase [Clostridia bacterium]